MHSNGIAHNDLKPANIVIDDQFNPKLIDYGMAKILNSSHTATKRCTNRYSAPEYWQYDPDHVNQCIEYPFAGDVFSFAVILGEIATGRIPWHNCSDIKSQIEGGTRPYTANQIDPDLFEIMEKSWQQHPKDRTDISKVLAMLQIRETFNQVTNHFNELYGIELFRACKKSIELVKPQLFESIFVRLLQCLDNYNIQQYIKTLSHLAPQMNQITTQITNPFAIAIMKCFQIGFNSDPEDIFKSLNSCNEDMADVFIGYFYLYGTGIEKDESKALKCFKKATDANLAAGYYYVGECYEKGYGCEIDHKEAFYFYELAAKLDYSSAYHQIGWFYKQEYVVLYPIEPDFKAALEYFKLGAKYGGATSYYNVGIYYQYGMGCEKNEAEAIKYYEIASELGYTDAKDEIDKIQNASNTNKNSPINNKSI
eukprot:NODE_889_length_3295_cov_0.386421.p1 type:complete len:424 gc:universal NODE_889_length_3295_cov_0.386421:2280-1009(-)